MEHFQAAVWSGMWFFILLGYLTTSYRWLGVAVGFFTIFGLTGPEPYKHMATWGEWTGLVILGVGLLVSVMAIISLWRGQAVAYLNFFRVK